MEGTFSFEYSLSELYDKTATINSPNQTTIKIIPTQVVQGSTFEYSYQVTKGKGYLVNEKGSTLQENKKYTTSSLGMLLNFMGTKTGEVEIDFIVEDVEGRKKTTKLNYIVNNNPFEWKASASLKQATIQEPTKFTVFLSNNGIDQNITYNSKYYISKGQGTIHQLDDKGNTTIEIQQNKSFEIVPKIHDYQVVFTKPGDNKIIFEATDSNGQTKKDSLEFTVNFIDFNLSVAGDGELFEKQNKEFYVLLSQNKEDSELEYQVRFTTESGSVGAGEIYQGEDKIAAAKFHSIPLGKNTYNFKALSKGEFTLLIEVKDSNGITNIAKLVYNIKEIPLPDFTFEAIETTSTADTDQCVDVNLNITEIHDSGAPYTFYFTTNSSGSFTYKDKTYKPGDIMEFDQNITTGCYQGDIAANHGIEFTMSNSNTTPVKRSDDFTLNIKEAFKYDLDIPKQITALAGKDIKFNINYSNNNDEITSVLGYDLTSQSHKLESDGYDLKSPFDLKNEHLIDYIYNNVGNFKINWRYIDTKANQENFVTSINIDHLPFNPTITGDTKSDIEDLYSFQIHVNPQESYQQYKIKSIKTKDAKKGEFHLNGTLIEKNVNIKYYDGYTYKPLLKFANEDHEIEVVLIDEFGQEKTITKTVYIERIDFAEFEIIPYSKKTTVRCNQDPSKIDYILTETFFKITLKSVIQGSSVTLSKINQEPLKEGDDIEESKNINIFVGQTILIPSKNDRKYSFVFTHPSTTLELIKGPFYNQDTNGIDKVDSCN